MSATKPRTDLPQVGAKIAVLHSGKGWYFGPLEVVDVDAPRQIVLLHADAAPPKHYVEHRPHPAGLTLLWNLVSDLNDDEKAEIERTNASARAAWEKAKSTVAIVADEPEGGMVRAISPKAYGGESELIGAPVSLDILTTGKRKLVETTK